MKQQLIERLNNLKNRTDRDYEFAGESQKSYDKGQIDILEEIQSLGDGWIPVTERLPEEGCYLAFSDGIMYVTATGNDSIFWNAGEIVSGVTHWMNLPNPPKQ